MDQKPNRVCVVGNCGSGKSTLSKALEQAWNLPMYHLDQMYWGPGWVSLDFNEFIEQHNKLIHQEKWIIDGSFSKTCAPRFERADMIILIELPIWRTLFQIIKRILSSYSKVRSDMAPGCPERIDFEFLLYVWNFPTTSLLRIKNELIKHQGKKNIIRLKSKQEYDDFIRNLR